jgi:AraC-like DNA-binding protein
LEYNGEVLERIIEQTQTHKAQALLSRGTFEVSQGNPERALCFYTEGLRTSPAISAYIGLARAIAVLKAQEGFHKSALRDMENLIPLIDDAEPRLYFDFLNSYAVELIEAGRFREAEPVAALAVSSHFGPYYPEWRETLSDVRSRRKRRSTAVISRPRIEQEYEAAIELEAPDLRIQTVIDFMSVNLHRRFALTQLAKVVNLSPSHLSRLFKTQTGVSPGEYLINLRMEKAGQLLAGTIKESTAEVGYHNKSNFVVQFKKHFGLPPSEYRKRAFTL